MNPLLRWFHQLGSPPYFDRFAARWTPWCYLAAIVLLGVGLWQALFVAPADYQQGDSFRILYIHVPSAWMSMAVYGLMAVYAVIAQVWRIKYREAELARRLPDDFAGVVREVAQMRLSRLVTSGWPIPEPTVRFWNSLVAGSSAPA